MSGGPGKVHANCQDDCFGGGIRNGDFRMEVESASACGRLLWKVRKSLLQLSVTYCTVGRYRDTNRSDRVCWVCSQGREVGTAVTGGWRLNVTSRAVTDREMHQQRTTATGLQELQVKDRKYRVSCENKTYKYIDDKNNTL